MALKGLDIYKLLPKTNCKECGLPTCLAFAMKVAGGQAGLEDCPSLSPDALSALSDADAAFLIVGAYAMAAHGLPRATGDIDIWIRPSKKTRIASGAH